MGFPAPLEQTVNQVEATLETRRGPVEKDQSAAPIAAAVGAYWEPDMLTSASPRTNGGRGAAARGGQVGLAPELPELRVVAPEQVARQLPRRGVRWLTTTGEPAAPGVAPQR